MLYFRSEEDIDAWCTTWRLQRGAVLPIELGWRLATAWYREDRREPSWRRRTPEESEAVFASLGLTSDFWRLR
ncbi:MAG TPA: hypothetical protein VGS96_00695 [Thermoanaerobaculia bacterium]|jgi:hypothetical protein|nr:hypothetical protein [Thermoanaerobaculia bacterium]